MLQPSQLDLVRPDDFGITSRHYYYLGRDRYDLSLADLASVGIVDDKCLVSRKLIPTLQQAQAQFKQLGYDLIVKDGYRSPQLYRLVYDKRVIRYGQTHTDSLLNVDRMIHAQGNVVDIDLAPLDGSRMRFRNGDDGIPAHFYGFYQNRTDPEAVIYQHNQDMMRDVMFGLGYTFGTVIEYWHFELTEARSGSSLS